METPVKRFNAAEYLGVLNRSNIETMAQLEMILANDGLTCDQLRLLCAYFNCSAAEISRKIAAYIGI